MAVYLNSGMVLLSGGSVATDASCCCGTCCLLHFTLWTHSLCEGTTEQCDAIPPGTCPEETCNLTGTFSVCDESVTESHFVSNLGTCDTGGGLFFFTLSRIYPDPNWYLGINVGCFGSSTGGPFNLGTSPLGMFSWDHLHDGSGSDVPYMNYQAMLTIDCGAPGAVGACCHCDGACVVETHASCNAVSGTYQGDATVCDPNPCKATGGCCVPVGDFFACLEGFYTQSVCEIDNGGTWLGGCVACENGVNCGE